MPGFPDRITSSALVLMTVMVCGPGLLRAMGAGADNPGATHASADLSTPAKATQAFVDAMEADDLSLIRAVTSNATQADYLTLRSWAAFTRSAERLRSAMDAKFGAGSGVGVMDSGLGPFKDASTLEIKTDGDTATVTSGGQHPKSLTLIKSDDQWRIDVARLPSKDQLSDGAAQMRAIGKVMDRLAVEVAVGHYAKADQVTAALGAAMQPIVQPSENDNTLARQPQSGRRAVDSPPKIPVAGYDPRIVDAQRFLYQWSGIPMGVELALKLAGREPGDYYGLQEEWKNKQDGNFINFDGRTITGVTFHHQFDEPRGNEFPTDKLFKTIDTELAQGRYVIISLYNGSGWGIYVIVGRTSAADYQAVSRTRRGQTLTVRDVKARVREMKGTDILTYAITNSNKAAH